MRRSKAHWLRINRGNPNRNMGRKYLGQVVVPLQYILDYARKNPLGTPTPTVTVKVEE
jgi:hypothetical protein